MSKEKQPISFIIPAYNCADTLEQAVHSIIVGGNLNEKAGEEIVIVNDGSTDNTEEVIGRLKLAYKGLITGYTHKYNMGGGAARNTAVQNAKHDLIFCLDSDNILEANSVPMLKWYMIGNECDAASFGLVKFFRGDDIRTTHVWNLSAGIITLADLFSKHHTPPAQGNYLYTKESWVRAGGYPCDHFLDAFGFGVRQLATGTKMCVMQKACYYHRIGINSYWMREDAKGNTWWAALCMILPLIKYIHPEDVEYIFGEGRVDWLGNRKKHPIRFVEEVKYEGDK